MNRVRFPASMTIFSSSITFAIAVGAFFLVDILSFGLLGWQMVQTLLCLYIVQVLICATEVRLMCIGFLLLLESFMMHDALFAPLIYLVPVLVLSVYARYIFYPGPLQRLCIATMVLLIQCLVVESWLLGLVCPMRYILYRLCVNLLLILFI